MQANLRENKFSLGPMSNPLFVAGQEFAKKMGSLELRTCTVCRNRWLSKLHPRSGKCDRCAREKAPQMYSAENDMHPSPLPPPLTDLTVIEHAAISPIHPMLKIYRHRGGGTVLKGHAISIEQDVQELATVLPRLPNDLDIISLRPPGSKVPFRASRTRIMEALHYLKRNNPEFANIVISQENANHYPESHSEEVAGLPQLDDTEPIDPSETEDNIEDSHADLEQVAESLSLLQIPGVSVNQQIQDAVTGQPSTPEIPWPTRSNVPTKELQRGYFT